MYMDHSLKLVTVQLSTHRSNLWTTQQLVIFPNLVIIKESIDNPLEKEVSGYTEGFISTIANAHATQSKTPITSSPGSNRNRKINT
ncbi:hypothetical protein HHI36_012588 [Cryptolaemus montrouzieri]|uniref:Uncharacterized protein n=1 Tax=Cryptolaemus montrouzieri TaxID=559131 RepID=A0ABD2NEX3_9CUCU